ncbi:hypothetical protein Lser_V15G40190 [Lactuca serriola]
MAEKLHPALMITNIRNFIPITLEMENAQYTSWAKLFKIHCRAFEVIDHIQPKVESTATVDGKQPPPVMSTDLWSRLDAIVIQWIYSTISNDLLQTILKPNSTAAQSWIALESIFQDNQNKRALYLEHKLVTTKLANFPNCSAYCQALKMLSDQLSNVGSPVSNQRLVLQLIAGLTESYEGIAMMIQQTKPLPDFYEARSRLILEETRKANHAAQSATTEATALNTQTSYNTGPTYQVQDSNSNNNINRGRGRGRGGRGRGHGRRGGGNFGVGRGQQQPLWPSPHTQQWSTSHSLSPFSQPWAALYSWPPTHTPPCPYPTNQPRSTAPGLLGPRPSTQQAYATSEKSYTPTDLEQAFHTMSLHPPYQNWYMDTGATSHMSNNSGFADTDATPPMQ